MDDDLRDNLIAGVDDQPPDSPIDYLAEGWLIRTQEVCLLDVVIQAEQVRNACKCPYRGHPKGCPNYNNPKRPTCPPKAKLYDKAYDLRKPVHAVVVTMNFDKHVAKMASNPKLKTEAQRRCCLYWQEGLRSRLRERCKAFIKEHPGYVADLCPEAGGVNVIATLRKVGIRLQVPPRNIVSKVAFIAYPKGK